MRFSINSLKIQSSNPRLIQASGTILIVFILSITLLQSRSLFHAGEAPAFFVDTSLQQGCWVEAQNAAGARQVFDVGASKGVDDMTQWLQATSDQRHFLKSLKYISGQHIEIVKHSHGVCRIKVSWMRAGKRMALGILLHPDRMGLNDWQDIKGIGPALAQRIVADRQKNGDFGTVANLTRVSGIGEKTVQSMQRWFSPRLYGPE